MSLISGKPCGCLVANRYKVLMDYLDDSGLSFGHQIVEADSAEEACELAVIEPLRAEDTENLTASGNEVRIIVLAWQAGNKADWAEMERVAQIASSQRLSL